MEKEIISEKSVPTDTVSYPESVTNPELLSPCVKSVLNQSLALRVAGESATFAVLKKHSGRVVSSSTKTFEGGL